MKKRDIALVFGGAIGAAVAVKMLTRAKTVNWRDVQDLVIHSDRSRFVNIDGIRIHFQEFGDAARPTIVLIHGYTASAYVWKTAAPLLANTGFHVVALDLVGFGYSEKPRSFEYTIGAQARMVSRFMDRLGIGRATIVGSSYGGAVAATLALDYAARVEKLVLVDAVTNDDLKKHPILRLASVRGLGEMITPFLSDSKALLRWRMRGSLADHALVTNERVESIRRPLFAADGHHSLLATSRNWHAERIGRDAHLITQPTLIVWGENDTVIPVRDGYKLRSDIADSRLAVLKNCGHVPQEEQTQIFTQLVAAFVSDKEQ